MATGAVLEPPAAEQVRDILVSKIVPSPYQPRRSFDPDKLKELAESIRANQLLQPIIVRPLNDSEETFELVAGERRLRAHKILERETIQAVVRNLTDEQARNLVLIENLQREDLSTMEEARCVSVLVDQFSGNRQAVADQLGKSLTYVNDRVAMLDLPREVQNMLDDKKINFAQGKVILEVEDGKNRIEAANLAVKLNLGAIQLRGRIQRLIKPKPNGGNNGKGESPQTGTVKFNKVSATVVGLYDALQKFDLANLQDPKKRDTLSKQIELLSKKLSQVKHELDKPVAKPQ